MNIQDEYKRYFFERIGSGEGEPANNWKAVLEALPGLGFGVNPKSGQIQASDAPHHGITVMIDAGGNARGRIWLPTDDAVSHEGNLWFTHEIQVIADGPTPGSMVWAWIDKGGAPVRTFRQPAPQPEPVPEPPATPTPAPGLPVDQMAEIRAALAAAEARLGESMAQAIGQLGDQIREQIREAQGRPWPTYTARILGQSVTLTPR
jgi:hypothetical protein